MKAAARLQTMGAPRGEGGVVSLVDRLSAPLLLIARVSLAFEFMLFGTRKFLHPEHVASMMSSHGIPGGLVWLVIPFQFFCGWLAALGLQTRLVSVGLGAFCIVAPCIFHTDNLDNWSRDIASAGGWMLLALFGPGRWSIDESLGRLRSAQARLAEHLRDVLMAVAGGLLAVHFISGGVRDLLSADPAAAQVGSAALGVPLAVLQILGGAMLFLGWKTRLACVVMAAYVLARASTVHSPAAELFRDGGGLLYFVDALFHSMGGLISSYGKDLAVFGALLALWVSGPGSLSLDAAGSRRRKLGQ